MNTMIHRALLAVAAIAATASVWAHHSNPQFDFTKWVTFTGTVRAFTSINPHTRMLLELKGARGTHMVEFMGQSISSMFRNGYHKGMVKVGDEITVLVAPNKDGTEGGYVIGGHVKGGEYFGDMSPSSVITGAKGAGEARRPAAGR